jgi:uncharacterized protein YjdB
LALDPDTIVAGFSVQSVATPRDDAGRPIDGRTIAFQSSAPAVATVSSSGLVLGIGPGSTTISATCDGQVASVELTVQSQQVTSLVIVPAAPSVPTGATAALIADVKDQLGQSMPNIPVTWSSESPSIVTVSSDGVVMGVALGTASVIASSAGATSQADVTVTQQPVASVQVSPSAVAVVRYQTRALSATGYDAGGQPVDGAVFSWSVADSTIAAVSALGVVTGKSAGSTTATAVSGDQAASATISVSDSLPAPVASITVTVNASALTTGQATQAVAALFDAAGNALAGRPVTWASASPALATVSSSGLILAVAPGSATISATAEGVDGRATVTVSAPAPAPVAAVTVSAPASEMEVGSTSQLTVSLVDSAGNVLSGRTIAYSSSNTALATVSSSGLVHGVAAGTVTITVASEGISGTLAMAVTMPPPVVASVTVSMGSTSLEIGEVQQASVVAKDAQGNAMSGLAVSWSVSSTSVLSVSAGGIVTAMSAGSAQVEATASGVTGSLTVTVHPPLPPPAPNGLTVPAALPLVYLNFPYTPKTGNTITVLAGGNLQGALNAAQRGDEIVLSAGAAFTGNFTLPPKPGTVANGWITIRTDKLNQLPPEGTRVTPAHATLMPKIITPNSSPAIGTQLGASGYRLVGVEVTASSSFTAPQFGLVWLGDGSSAQNLLSEVASDLVLDRVYVHGQTTTDTRRCVSLNSARTQISDSYMTECHSHGTDSQAIQGHNGPGPYKIVNNTLIAATENIVFGGGDPWISGMIPRDIEIRRNYLYTPPSWKGVWLKKNLFELKAGQRILIEGNVLDGSWTDGQTGWAFMLKTENQSGGCTWCTTSDITIRYNYIRNAGAGIAITGKEGSSPHPVGALSARFTVQNNVMDHINVGVFTGDERFFQVLGNASDIEIANNTMTTTGRMGTFLMLENFPSVTRLAFNRNATSAATYGMLAQGRGEGTPALGAVAGGWQFAGNYLIGSPRGVYPAGTTYVSSLASVPRGFGADQATLNTKIAGVIIP